MSGLRLLLADRRQDRGMLREQLYVTVPPQLLRSLRTLSWNHVVVVQGEGYFAPLLLAVARL